MLQSAIRVLPGLDCGSSAYPGDRHQAMLAGTCRSNGLSNAGGAGHESGAGAVVDRNDGNGCVRLFRRHTFVCGDESSEAAAFGCGQEFVVAERTPVVEFGRFDRDNAELLPEWATEARRYADVKEYLHAGASGGGSAVGIAGGGGADGRCSGTQDGGGRPAIDLKLAQELVQRDAVLDPVRELLDGQARTAKTGHAAHARGLDPYGFCQRHGTISALGIGHHGRAVRGPTNTEEDRLRGASAQ